jgi:hypothetical protein
VAVAISSYAEVTSWQASSGGAKATASAVTWPDGALVVFVGGSEGTTAITLPTATGLTFSSVKSNTAASSCSTQLAVATAVGGNSQLVSSSCAAGFWGFGVWVLTGHGGVGVSVEQHTTTHTASMSPVAGSLGIWGAFDFSAAVAQGLLPAPDNTRENSTSTQYTAYAADANNLAGGATGFGLAAGGTAGVISIVALEVLAASATALPPGPRRFPLGV